MPTPDIHALSRHSASLMRSRLGARGATLEEALRQRGRRLPHKIRCAARDLVEAEAMAAHPRLRLLLDGARIERSGRVVINHLRPLGVTERRRALMLSIAASMAFGLLVTIAGVIAALVWRGLL